MAVKSSAQCSDGVSSLFDRGEDHALARLGRIHSAHLHSAHWFSIFQSEVLMVVLPDCRNRLQTFEAPLRVMNPMGFGDR
jgi:hypothetical protein